MFGPVGWQEILMILVLALLVFGPRRLPELGRTLGRALAEFRRATSDLKRTLNAELALEEGERSRAPRRPELTPASADPSEPSEPGSEPRTKPAGPPVATMPRGVDALDLAGVVDDGTEEPAEAASSEASEAPSTSEASEASEVEPSPAQAPEKAPEKADPGSETSSAEREPATTH